MIAWPVLGTSSTYALPRVALTRATFVAAIAIGLIAAPLGLLFRRLMTSARTAAPRGWRSVVAISLVFALFQINPAPFCLLDEVDAPLDDANIDRFCDLLDRMARDTATRYLVVTHNAVTMSRMHRLFGVTMIEPGVSRLVSVDLQAATILVAA